MGRHSCCFKQKLRKGLWSPEEDEKLLNYITRNGHGCWSSVPKLAGQNPSTMFQSMPSTIFPPQTANVNSNNNPSSISSSDIGGVQNWEISKSNGSISSSINILESNVHHHHHHVPSLQDDIKWCEYLDTTPFFLGNSNNVQHQIETSIYSDEVKPEETGFITDEYSSTSWNNNTNNLSQQQQQYYSVFDQPASSSDIYTKDLERFSMAFGQTM
ncbi:hypothetical protein RIF29_24643 [Crotalaria pallida]|uniref:Uncharacterized protein n=1 Tax=Crotalaria pallida TaxID=3830 RepID=A0AAN9EK63_CROPI